MHSPEARRNRRRRRNICIAVLVAGLMLLLNLPMFMYLKWSWSSQGSPHDAASSGGFLSGESPALETVHISRRVFTKEPKITIIIPVRTDVFPTKLVHGLWRSDQFEGYTVSVVVVLHEEFPQMVVPHVLPDVIKVVRSPRGTLLNYGTMCNLGAASAEKDADLFFFLSPTHVPRGSTTMSDLAIQLADHLMSNEHAGIVGSTVVVTEHEGGNTRSAILERGLEVMFGNEKEDPVIVLRKALNGFSDQDARVADSSKVVAVSPYCFMIEVDLFTGLGGFPRTSNSFMEHLLTGRQYGNRFTNALDLVRFRITKLERAMEAISLSEVHSAGSELRQRIREAYAEVVGATTLWEECADGVVFDDAVDQPNEYGASMDRPDAPDAVLEEKLQQYSKDLSDAAEELRILNKGRGGATTEEEAGWEMCMRAARVQREVHVVNATVQLEPSGFPQVYLNYFAKSRLPVLHPSHVSSGAFEKKWNGFLRQIHPTTAHKKKYLLRVVWTAYCCECCGFSNEIVHLVSPLQKYYHVNTLLDLNCYCQGFPRSVMDGLSHMHITPKQYESQKFAPDEIMVFVSHTDPMSISNAVFNRRKPDYVVGRSMYEFSRIEDAWVHACNTVPDEIWVPSVFVKNVFETSGVHPDKLVIIPEAIDVYAFDPNVATRVNLPPHGPNAHWRHWANRPYEAAQQNYFKFLSNFKWEPRKGWEVLFFAYFSEFSAADEVSLYIMTHIWFPGGPDTYGDKNNCTYLSESVLTFAASVGFDVNNLPHFAFITEDMSEIDVINSYASVDAFVLPTRGEGWGLPSMQALAMGLPTIGTNFGGQVDFMHPWNSFLIRVDGVEELPVNNPYGWWHEGKRWAMPSVSHTRELLRYVRQNPDHAKRVGRRARKYMKEKFSEDAIAAQIDRRLQHIHDIVARRRSGETVPTSKPPSS
eukprot:PhM_4_TR8780/c0_g1_i1/m.49513